MLTHYQLFITVVMIYVLWTTLYNLRHMLRLPSEAPCPWPPPLVSVLVPARNEARNIRACLESLLKQDYPNLEILVLDDDSSDATPEIVRQLAAHHPRLRLLSGQPLPPDWHGKAWACQQLAQHARGEWLLFVDADTRLRSDCLSSALAVAWANGLDLVSLLPDMALRTFGERVIMAVIPFVFIACVPHFAFTWTRYPGLVAALGPFMLFRAETYRRFGGHEAVRRDIVEDVMIARWVKRAGGRVALVDGVATLRVEFYQGFREAWYGLSKSAFPAFDYSLLGLLLALGAFALVFLGPYLFLYGAWRDGLRDLPHFWLPLAQVSCGVLAVGLIDGRVRIPRPYALLLGLTVLVAMLFSLHSVWSHLWGPGTVWKGRTYQFREREQGGKP